MKITLMEDHTHDGVFHKVGEEIDVSKDTYDFLMKYYMSKREAEVIKQQKIAAELAKPIAKKGPK